MMMHSMSLRAGVAVPSAIAALTVGLTGCQSSSPARPESRVISLGEFAAQPEQPAISYDEPTMDREPLVLGAGGSESIGPEQLVADPLETSPGPAQDYVVESLIGQVNGRPIYADEFFAPIEDQLIAIARRETPRRFQQAAQQIVEMHLRNIVQNELFLAEAESELTEQEQVGLFAFMRNVQEQTISDRGGIESVTRSRLLNEEGITLDQYLELKKDETLIRKLVAERISPRVIISWRDIQREYERRFDEFNPPAHVTIWRIVLSTERDAEQIASVAERLNKGEPFMEIANSIGGRQSGEYGRFELGPNGLADIELSEALIAQLEGLEAGDTTSPFEVGTRTWWLHISEFHQPEPLSVYDPTVQRQLAEALFAVRFEEEQNRLMDSLLEDGIYDELTAMRNRLVAIAIQRYAP